MFAFSLLFAIWFDSVSLVLKKPLFVVHCLSKFFPFY